MKLFKLAHQTMNYRAKNRLVVAKILEFAPVTGSLRAGGLFGWNVCTQASYRRHDSINLSYRKYEKSEAYII